MGLSRHLQFTLNKHFEPDSLITMRYKGQDLAFKTDPEGNPILLFIGRKDKNGKIKGERYVRAFKKDVLENIIKDHWELKGKS